ncbi:MAG TPA: FxLD family lanthipeptide [Pseudonocardiaceae bacterium]|jgi:FxLD family lantipeptide
MTDSFPGPTTLTEDGTALDGEFALDVRVVEAAQPDGNLLLSTSDNCGSTCEKDACITFTGDPS